MNSERYVIWLSDKPDDEDWKTSYGYYSGKDYTRYGELFPVTDKCVTERTKIYSSSKRAENALKSILNKPYAYVCNGRIEKLN